MQANLHLKSRHGQRIKDAELLSVEFNVKDKLPMSSFDKIDTAWRITAQYTDMSKEAVSNSTTVSTSTVATMRKVKNILLAAGKWDIHELAGWRWGRARWEHARLIDPNLKDEQLGERDEMQIRLMVKAMQDVLRRGVEPQNILEAFHRIDPSLIGQLESALEQRKLLEGLVI